MPDLEQLDLLVFGPHPDDLEIGLGGTIARHVALGQRVGLCDLTSGEMGSNGTVDERRTESENARIVLGASWRVTALVAPVATLAIHFAFYKALRVPLPWGMFERWAF